MDMVRKFTSIWALLSILISVSGCNLLNKVWGEGAPGRATVEESGETLPDFTLVFGDDDSVAIQTLTKWRQNVLNSFHQVQGSERDFLKTSEIETLVKLGFLKLDPDRAVSVSRATAILELLGYKNGISSQNVSALFDWIANNREQARIFYKSIALNQGDKPLEWTVKDLLSVINVFGSLVARVGDEPLETAHMADLIRPWIPEDHPHAKAGLKSGIDLFIGFFASFCGDRVETKAWNGFKIGKCLTDFTAHFEPATVAVDYVFGKINPLLDPEKLKASSDLLPQLVESWLKDHHHPLFSISNISEFSKAIDIPPPYAFIDLSAWIPKLNKDSTALAFNPIFAIDLTRVAQSWINTTLSKITTEKCTELNWRECEYEGGYDTLERLYSDQYANLIRHKNLGLVSKVAFYESVSAFLMQKLDTDRDGFLSDDIKDLISVVISMIDTSSYLQNVIARTLEKPFKVASTEDTLHSIHREGLSELIALAADLIPERDQARKNFLARIEAQVITPEQKLPYAIDSLGLTAFLYTYDLMNDLREDYLKHYDLPERVTISSEYIRRRDVIASLPVMIHDHFPRIYEQCIGWGFEKTCGVVFSEVLAGGSKEGEVGTSEMDTLSLTAILIESMMNRCDANQDGLLKSGIFHPTDEKHCVLDVTTAVAQRLMRANIVTPNSSAQNWISLIQGVAPVRWAAQGALSRGTLHGIGWFALPPFSFFSHAATLGSVMSLAAEFMSPDKSKAIAAGTVGPTGSSGDELLYQNQLTEHYLVTSENSHRH